ncbi:DNA/RNA helicase [Salinisphaera dokdonensis CL-ES53]|uniref:DNA/RNA helicase n=1 Tax=Salinisphaera dokdonensis CL-ES53 TaxID=1304272 RepID=A0ABV2AZ09_9GAMM
MASTLEWTANASGIVFEMKSDQGALPISHWARTAAIDKNRQPLNLAPLTRAIERTLLDAGDQSSLTVSNVEIEALSERQLSQIGLPSAAPLRLRLGGEGTVTSSQFRLKHQLVRSNGTPVMGGARNGVLLSAGGKQMTLLYPLYSLLSGIEAFNAAAGADNAESRLLRWAELKELLPESAQIDDHLKTVNIVRADAFTLDTDTTGRIAPVLRHRIPPEQDAEGDGSDAIGVDELSSFEDALPPNPHKSFAQRFEQSGKVTSRYTAEGHWFIVLPPIVERGLEVVKRYQTASTEERLAFLANPKRALVSALEDDFDSEAIDSLFEETPTFLSQRVQCLGHWHPKSFSYSLPSASQWFPEESAGAFLIELGDRLIPIAGSEATLVLKQMKDALTDGEQEITHGGQTIPVSEETIDRFESAVAAHTTQQPAGPSIEEPPPNREQNDPRDDSDLKPVIDDNLESLGFSHRPHAARGKAGGLPAVLKTTRLYPHQKDGLRWLQDHWALGSNGALLADDMGLGKTLQTLAFLAWVQEQNAHRRDAGPFLIIAPTGLLKNWEAEEITHLARPGLGELLPAYGKGLKQLAGMTSKERRERMSSADWVMTTYETLRDKIQYFMDIAWSVVAYDEIQKIKNPTSLIHDMAKAVHGDFFLALTGTPVENRVSDIWSIIDTIAPGQLGSLKDFQSTYEPGSKSDSIDQSGPLSTLRQNLLEDNPPPRILRRMKADHLRGLPEKVIHRLQQLMPIEQANAYDQVLGTLRGTEPAPGRVLKALQQLRRISLSHHDLSADGLTDTTVHQSARVKALIGELDQIAARGEKALIFIEYRVFQDHLIAYLQNRYEMSIPPRRINGQTTAQRRQKIVTDFQNGPDGEFDVLVLSPKAAGVGLTLTAANHVFHLSRWWNPAVEDQCTDRVFRIGQNRPVHVYYPIAVHANYPESSFDINLDQLLERKRGLSSDLLTPADSSAGELDDLLNSSLS